MRRSLSQIVHDMIWTDTSQSLCARAYDLRDVSAFWRAWVIVFGERHCRASWLWHRRNH